LQSTPQVLNTVQANASGVISVPVTIPSGVSSGAHTLSALGTTSGVGSRTALTIPASFTIVALDSPKRLVDTRESGGRFGSSSTSGVSVLRLKVAGATTVKGAATGLPSSGVGAVAMNVTVVDGKDKGGYGFVTVYPCASTSTPVPDASNLNFAGGQTVPNSVLAPLSADGYVCFSVYGDTHLLVDVSAYA
jgi:serine protease